MSHMLRQLLQTSFHLQHRPERVFRLLIDSPAVLHHLLLPQVTEPNSSGVMDGPAIGVHLSRQDPQERGLAAPVAAHETQFLAPG